MAIIVSSGSVCPNLRPLQRAKPPLLRSLAWTLGIQAAVGGTLIMIHDQVISGGGASGIVCISSVDVEKPPEASHPHNVPINILPPEPVVYRQLDKVKEMNPSFLVMSDLLATYDIPRVEEKTGLFLNNEDFGLMIRSKEKTATRSQSQSEKTLSKMGGQASSPLIAAASSGKGESGSSSARYKSAPSPPYPHSARVEGREGIVMLKVLIDETGKPSEVDIAQSSGCLALDNAALDWVRQNWFFYPAMNETKPVASTMIAPLKFKLSK